MNSKSTDELSGVWPGFNGELHEPGTGWQMLGNGYRVYNPVLMRFHSPDILSPFGKGGLNAYAYCAGDPVNRVDPTGHTGGAVLRLLRSVKTVEDVGEETLTPWLSTGGLSTPLVKARAADEVMLGRLLKLKRSDFESATDAFNHVGNRLGFKSKEALSAQHLAARASQAFESMERAYNYVRHRIGHQALTRQSRQSLVKKLAGYDTMSNSVGGNAVRETDQQARIIRVGAVAS